MLDLKDITNSSDLVLLIERVIYLDKNPLKMSYYWKKRKKHIKWKFRKSEIHVYSQGFSDNKLQWPNCL